MASGGFVNRVTFFLSHERGTYRRHQGMVHGDVRRHEAGA
jgi:hypothetical protein